MKRAFGLFLVGLLVAGFAAPAQGTVVMRQHITLDGIPDRWDDNSAGLTIRGDDTVLDHAEPLIEGDVLVGFFRFDDSSEGGTIDENLVGVFSFTVDAVIPGPNPLDPVGATVLTRPTVGDFSIVNMLQTVGFDPFALTTVAGNGTFDNAVIALFESQQDNISREDYEPFPDGDIFFSNNTIAGQIEPGDWTLNFITGFEEGDFHEIRIDEDPAGITAGDAFARFRSASTILADALGGLDYLPMSRSGFASPGTEATFIGSGSIQRPPATLDGWSTGDRGEFLINPVPEPGSIVVWSLLMACAGFAFYRRRHRKAVAA